MSVRLEDLSTGSEVAGLHPAAAVNLLAVEWYGDDAVNVTYQGPNGDLGQRVLYRSDEDGLELVTTDGHRQFDADGADFRLAAEAQRIQAAGQFDPMLAVATSDIEPLPHQIRAVYGELLPRMPLRFLLADDPGAGKTIMAGLYIKELLLRGDVNRCLIVAPGGLVEQWQDELSMKFSLTFEILTTAHIDNTVGGSAFERHPLLIARMDQLGRNEEMLAQLRQSDWDLVVVDEAHRMAAHYYGNERKMTRRYELGQLLETITRHLLLMTATPHAGKDEDFHLFLALLDPDRFEGKYRPGVHSADTTGIMRRMVKEDLLTFEGKPLFPERIAETVPYELSNLEMELYEDVTQYVREEMNRADRLSKKRKNTVGFALTVLQRRLASSPEAILKSLQRRQARLEKRRKEVLDPTAAPEAPTKELDIDLYDDEEWSAEEQEGIEEELLDSATAAQTLEELNHELAVLADMEQLARRVRTSGEDRKWTELRSIVEERAMGSDADGTPRKLIVFTEHKDTLAYLAERIGALLGRHEAVVAIHGGVRRSERRRITEEFTHNPNCRVLVATDAAGEGLNLQRAHLMVNYDLPWNPNRIEQRFGRIHRIGQREVCRLWNLVASETREGDVFTRLLAKVEEQRQAYGGKVFDVLGQAFEGQPLRDLLIEAIRYGDQPEVKARLDRVIDASVSDGLRELIDEHSLSREVLAKADVEKLRREMDEARARRLQPHYIEMFFREALSRIGGRMSRRERGRWEIRNVPAALRQRDRRGMPSMVATQYERITFDTRHIHPTGLVRADLLAPGHPLLDAVIAETLERQGETLTCGAILVDPLGETGSEPRMLLGLSEEIDNGLGETVARRFGYVFVSPAGIPIMAGPAPYLECAPLGDGHTEAATPAVERFGGDAESQAVGWIVQHELPDFLRGVGGRITVDANRTRDAVAARLNPEINRLYAAAGEAEAREEAGETPRVRAATLLQRVHEIEARLDRRMRKLDAQARLALKPPRVVSAALVIPPPGVPGVEARRYAKETAEVERRGVDAVLAAERALGREPVEMHHNNPGYDIESPGPDGHLIFIEVKARILGSDVFHVTYNEVLHGKNAAPHYRLALVSVEPEGAAHDTVRYLDNPFSTVELGSFAATGIDGNWKSEWAKGRAPF